MKDYEPPSILTILYWRCLAHWDCFWYWLLPETVTRCHQTEDGKHVYDPYTRAHGFDRCIWCGKRREKGWME